MKTIIALTLCCALCAAQAQSTNAPAKGQNEPKFGLACMIVVSIAVAGIVGYAVYRVASLCPDQHSPVTLVLEKSNDHSNWSPVYTNTVILNGTNAVD